MKIIIEISETAPGHLAFSMTANDTASPLEARAAQDIADAVVKGIDANKQKCGLTSPDSARRIVQWLGLDAGPHVPVDIHPPISLADAEAKNQAALAPHRIISLKEARGRK